MQGLRGFFKRHINSWNEICVDEKARLRTNTIIFTFAVLCFFAVMLIVDIATGNMGLLPMTLALFFIELGLFVTQLLCRRYLTPVAWIFGALALMMSAYFLYTGGLGGYSFIWVFLVPHIAVMVLPTLHSVIYNMLLLVMSLVMLNTPLYAHLGHTYGPYFTSLFPLGLLFMCLCVYIAELVRYKIQRQLKVTADELESFAFTDPLTGAYNRRALVSHFGGMDESAYGLAFAILDLDYFKTVNDRHSHVVGDRMLRHVVSLIMACIPPGTPLYRWGGEEFLLVIKSSDIHTVRGILEDIRQRIEHTPLSEAEGDIKMTISIGGMCAAKSDTIRKCVEEADEQLYVAKTKGRNRVII